MCHILLHSPLPGRCVIPTSVYEIENVVFSHGKEKFMLFETTYCP